MITLSELIVTESNRVFKITKHTLWMAGCKKVKQTKLDRKPYTVETA
jgi:hypothetical protein